jgi:hypothetical protein
LIWFFKNIAICLFDSAEDVLLTRIDAPRHPWKPSLEDSSCAWPRSAASAGSRRAWIATNVFHLSTPTKITFFEAPFQPNR